MAGKSLFETDGHNLSPTLRERFDTDPEYRQKLVETMQFIDEFRRGRIARARFAETMTTNDFPGCSAASSTGRCSAVTGRTRPPTRTGAASTATRRTSANWSGTTSISGTEP